MACLPVLVIWCCSKKICVLERDARDAAAAAAGVGSGRDVVTFCASTTEYELVVFF